MLECIENKIFQQFLVTDSHLEQSCKKEFWIWKRTNSHVDVDNVVTFVKNNAETFKS